MADIDDFATSLLEEAKRFYEKACEVESGDGREAYLHAALLLAFCALEAHVNAISEEFANRPEISVHVKGVLLEKDVKLDNGEFVLSSFRMSRLEDRILLLNRHFSGKPLEKTITWWSQLKTALDMRNKLTHPKAAHPLTADNVRDALSGIIEALDALYRTIYKKPLPVAGLALHSRLGF